MKFRENTPLVVVLILLAAATRLLPHPPNFTAVGAVALFGGAYLSRRLAVIVPVAALFLSDLALNNLIYAKQFPEMYDGFVLYSKGSILIYACFIAIVFLGAGLLRRVKVTNVLFASVLASVLFFVVTNFAVWLSVPAYPTNAAGLIACYTAALPFFWNTLMSTVIFSAVLFGLYEFVESRRAKAHEAT